MVCKDVRARIFEYLDAELPAREREVVECHLAQCPECRAVVDTEVEFRERYIAPLRPPPVPERVRERVARLLETLPAAPPRARWLPRSLFPPRAFAVAVAALLLVALGGLIGVVLERGLTERRPTLLGLAEASVAQHQKLTRGVVPHDITGVSPKDAEQWFRRRLDFNVSLPEQLPGDRLTMVGGRISHLGELEVAALHYRMDEHDISLFVIPLERFRQLRLGETPKFKMLTHNGYDVIVWASHGSGYALVSEIGGRSCLVCHSPDENLGLAPPSPTHP